MDSRLGPPPDGDQNRYRPMIGIVVAGIFFSILFVVLRMYTRLSINKSARWDDWTIVVAVIGTTVGMILDIVCIYYGYGRHEYYLSEHQIQEFKKFVYGNWIQTMQTLMLQKISICLLLLRISPSKRIIRPIQAFIAFLIVTNIVLTLLYILQCIPLDGAWDAKKMKTAKCFTPGQVQRIIISQALISLISDFVLAGFPIIILRNVQIKLRHKILLCSLMGVGLVTAACCMVRTIMNWQNVHADETWVGVDNWFWRTVEVNIGIVAACVPTLLPLYRLCYDKLVTAHQRLSSSSGPFNKYFANPSSKTVVASSPTQQGWGSHDRNALPPLPHNSEWKRAPPHPFARIEKSADEDLEMSAGILEHV